MSTTLSTYMNLPVPVVGNEPGPDYATDINNCLTLVDQHNHSAGSGQQITPDGLNINADLDLLNNNLLNIKSLRMAPQTSIIPSLSLYVKQGSEVSPIYDLWFNDGNGTPVQITENGLVKVTAASIPGQSYSAGTFIWKQGAGSTTPANFDIGEITLRPNAPATAFGTTLIANPAISTAFTLTLPNNPVGLSGDYFMTISPAGVIAPYAPIAAGLDYTNLSATAGILGAQIASHTISEANLVANTITAASIADHTITQKQMYQGSLITSTPGSSTFTVPANVTRLTIVACGGGGGGGGSTPSGMAGSGGNGAVPETIFMEVTPAQVVSYTIGAGGAPGSGAGTGSEGGITYFAGYKFYGGLGAGANGASNTTVFNRYGRQTYGGYGGNSGGAYSGGAGEAGALGAGGSPGSNFSGANGGGGGGGGSIGAGGNGEDGGGHGQFGSSGSIGAGGGGAGCGGSPGTGFYGGPGYLAIYW